jgi:hypothetical protein
VCLRGPVHIFPDDQIGVARQGSELVGRDAQGHSHLAHRQAFLVRHHVGDQSGVPAPLLAGASVRHQAAQVVVIGQG